MSRTHPLSASPEGSASHRYIRTADDEIATMKQDLPPGGREIIDVLLTADEPNYLTLIETIQNFPQESMRRAFAWELASRLVTPDDTMRYRCHRALADLGSDAYFVLLKFLKSNAYDFECHFGALPWVWRVGARMGLDRFYAFVDFGEAVLTKSPDREADRRVDRFVADFRHELPTLLPFKDLPAADKKLDEFLIHNRGESCRTSSALFERFNGTVGSRRCFDGVDTP